MILFLACCTFFTSGQENWEIGASIGATNYLGDLVEPAFTFAQSKIAYSTHLRYRWKDHLNFRSNLLIGKLVGDDDNYQISPERGASFESSLIELTLLFEYNLFALPTSGEGNFVERISPYGFLGTGFSLINPSVQFDASTPEIDRDLAEDYADIQPIIPIGIGVKYNLAKNLTVGLEFGMHYTFTDYLDGVSLSGDPGNNDQYFSWGVNVSYLLGNTDADFDGIADKRDKCPNLPGPEKFDGCPDSDGDGIVDSEDECPNEPGRALLKGCPDSDNDGVSDFIDDCPDDPGIRRLGGCPDSDNDGIVDPEDNCPLEAGIPSLNGCPDADRDGITDAKDECPTEPGKYELNGCPDKDEDGIADKYDSCPEEAGKPSNKGCPDKDFDGDGLLDRNDRCPEVAGPLENNGCPVIAKEDLAVLEYAMTSVEFELGSDVLKPSSYGILNNISLIINKYKGYLLKIHGHTDNKGEPEKNLQLSENRAKACFNYLFSKGINPTLMQYQGFGDTMPIESNETDEGRDKNRRIEFILEIKNK
ncbi:MAG: DUF6089 family protein [Bacteroidota bacterium]